MYVCLQAVRGKFMSIKKTMTMGDLLCQMVTDAKLEAEQALRQLVAGLNGAAALHIIRQVSGTLVTLLAVQRTTTSSSKKCGFIGILVPTRFQKLGNTILLENKCFTKN